MKVDFSVHLKPQAVKLINPKIGVETWTNKQVITSVSNKLEWECFMDQ
ncbi:hypothetical protein [Rippkaea orientalis]|nr:hypothetical protein [Rippkaea orientalis]